MMANYDFRDSGLPLFSASEIWSVISALDAKGVALDPSALGGLDPRDLLDPSRRVTLAQLIASERLALQHLTAAERSAAGTRQHLTAFGIVGFAIMTCATLGDAIRLADELWCLINLKFRIDLQVCERSARLRLVDHLPLPSDVRPAFVRSELQKLVIFLRDLLGAEFTPSSISVATSDNEECPSTVQGCAVISGLETSIEIPAAMLARPLLQAHPITHGAAVADCQRMLASFNKQPPLVSRVREHFDKLNIVVPTLSDIASNLAMSERTLRRRLQDLGTSYSHILEQVRFAEAQRHLHTGGISTDRISEMLGYTETANFRHAFRRWAGQSPQSYRRLVVHSSHASPNRD